MISKISRIAIVAVAVSLCFSAQKCQAQTGVVQDSAVGDKLFYNYYTMPGASTAHAGAYIAPRPVPHNVGHTYYTYQPLRPHEHLYTHRRNYYNYYAGRDTFYKDPCSCGPDGGCAAGGALNKTTVVWQSGQNHIGTLPGTWAPVARATYLVHKWRFCLGKY